MPKTLGRAALIAAVLLAAAVFVCRAPQIGLITNKYIRKAAELPLKRQIERSGEGLDVLRFKKASIFYTRGDYEYAKAAKTAIETYLSPLANEFGLAEAPRVTLYIYPDRKSMYDAIGYASKHEQTGSAADNGPTGAYSAGIIAVLSPSALSAEEAGYEPGELLTESSLIHELCHFLLDKKTNGNYSQWFAEGTALYYENIYIGREPPKAVPRAKITYLRLSESFKYLSKEQSYEKSFKIVDFIAGKKGVRSLKKIYDSLEAGRSLKASIEEVLGETFAELDKL